MPVTLENIDTTVLTTVLNFTGPGLLWVRAPGDVDVEEFQAVLEEYAPDVSMVITPHDFEITALSEEDMRQHGWERTVTNEPMWAEIGVPKISFTGEFLGFYMPNGETRPIYVQEFLPSSDAVTYIYGPLPGAPFREPDVVSHARIREIAWVNGGTVYTSIPTPGT